MFDVTDPDLLIPLHEKVGVPDRHSIDQRESQPSTSDSQTASLWPSSNEATTTEASDVLPEHQ